MINMKKILLSILSFLAVFVTFSSMAQANCPKPVEYVDMHPHKMERKASWGKPKFQYPEWKIFDSSNLETANTRYYMMWINDAQSESEVCDNTHHDKVFPSGEPINQAWLDKAAKFQPIAIYLGDFVHDTARKLGVVQVSTAGDFSDRPFTQVRVLFDSVGDDAMSMQDYQNSVSFCSLIEDAVGKGSVGYFPRYIAFGCYASYIQSLPVPKTFADIEACAIKKAWDTDTTAPSDMTIDDRIKRVKAAIAPCVSRRAVQYIAAYHRHIRRMMANDDTIYVTVD